MGWIFLLKETRRSEEARELRRQARRYGTTYATGGAVRELAGAAVQSVAAGPKVPRNATCPCGSGKKFKKCCGDPGQRYPRDAEQKRATARASGPAGGGSWSLRDEDLARAGRERLLHNLG